MLEHLGVRTVPNALSVALIRSAGYLRDQPSAGGFWTVDYYRQYFDVDTQTVLMRCYAAMVPTSDFVADVCDSKPDMYGPFWTLTVRPRDLRTQPRY